MSNKLKTAKLWHQLVNGQKNYHKYKSQLEDIKTISYQKMFETQIKNLQAAERFGSRSYQEAHNFLNSAKINLNKLENKLPKEVERHLEGRILELLNLGLWGNENNPTKRLHNNQINQYSQRSSEVMAIVKELLSVLKQLDVSKEVRKETVDLLIKRLRKQQGKNELYTQEKALQAEKIATDLLNHHPGWKAIQTGQFEDDLHQQLIEDVMVFDEKELDKIFSSYDGFLEFKVVQNKSVIKNVRVNNTRDFFKELDKLNGLKVTIRLDDGMYDVLKTASLLSAQVKSGRNNQPILTGAERNSIRLDESGIGLNNSYNVLTMMLDDYYNINWKNLNSQKSSELNALANMTLSHSILATKISRNQLYYTEYGFTTASEWMEKTQHMIRFTDPGVIKMPQDLFNNSYKYQIYSVSKKA